jgi:ribosome biogenesis GTPase / thiamine phosphate phosphatase
MGDTPRSSDKHPRGAHREYARRKGVERDWRKGEGRWRFDGDEESDRPDSESARSAPRKFRMARPANERNALVLQTGGPHVLLLDGEETLRAQARRATTTENGDATLVVIGDRVQYIVSGEGDAIITHVHERRSALMRSSVSTRDFHQVLAANVDLVVVVTAATRELLRPGLIDRYIVSAAMGGMDAAICVNKIDLLDDDDREIIDDLDAMYDAAGYSVVRTSAETGDGIDALSQLVRGRICVFSGHSGVGKTSLINQLIPGLSEKTQELSDQSQRGAHTTTRSTLYPFGDGGWLADTPGIREFGLKHFEATDLHRYYPEFVSVADKCRFASCTHVHEPGCAVIAAVEVEEIHPMRYRNYIQILTSEQGE